MSKVITFSTVFPKTHFRSGVKTHFVEKILDGRKKHTIRAGNRWQVGDKFSPRIWSGLPYRSKQEIIAEDFTIKKIYDIEISFLNQVFINYFFPPVTKDIIEKLANERI